MNNLEELNRKARIERLKSKFEVAKSYGSDQLTVPMPDLDALIAQLEAAQLELIKPLPIGELLHRLEGQTYRKWYDDDELNKWRERAEKAEAELSAANERIEELELNQIEQNDANSVLSAALDAANEKHGWVKRSHQMPDPNQQRRVCVFTPNDAADLRYRLVPASLFKAVCSSATHWYYVNDPVEGNADAE